MTERNTEIQGKAVNAAKWAYVARYLPTITSLIAQIFLARLLLPSDYGIVGICASLIAFTMIFQGGRGVGLAIIQAKEDSEEDYKAALTMNLMLGAVIYISLLALIPLIAIYTREPRIGPVIALQGLSILMSSYSSVLIARLQRNFGFKNIALRMIPQSLVPLAVGVPMACAHFGYWSLVVSSLVGDVISVILLTLMVGWLPKVTWDVKRFIHLFKFSRWLIIEDIIAWVINNADTFLIARFLSMNDVGIYVFAKKIVTIGVGGIISPLSPIMYSAFCRLTDDKEHLKKTYLNVTKIVAIVSLPITIGLAIAAPKLMPLVFGAKWTAAGIIVSLFALSEISYLATPGLQLYGALGKPHLNAIIMLTGGVTTLVGYIIAVPYGLNWFMCARLTGLLLVLTPVSLCITQSILKIRFLQFCGVLRSSLLSATLLTVFLFAMMNAYSKITLNTLWSLVFFGVVSLLSVSVYMLALRSIDQKGFRMITNIGKGIAGV